MTSGYGNNEDHMRNGWRHSREYNRGRSHSRSLREHLCSSKSHVWMVFTILSFISFSNVNSWGVSSFTITTPIANKNPNTYGDRAFDNKNNKKHNHKQPYKSNSNGKKNVNFPAQVGRINTCIRSQKTHLASSASEGEEWYPSDPADTTPQLLSALWFLISDGCSRLGKGETNTVLFPNMEKELSDPIFLEKLMGHLDMCKDCCDDFGVNTILSPRYRKVAKIGKNSDVSVVEGFTVKSYRNPTAVGALPSDGNYEFHYDPMWDGPSDDWDALEEAIKKHVEEEDEEDKLSMMDNNYENGRDSKNKPLPEIEVQVPDDDEEIISITKTWVGKMMSDMGVCPFTNGAEMAGLPMGQVFYTTDRSTSVEDVYARYWKEVVRVEQNNEKDLSTTLLILPKFLINNVELFENFSNSLTHPLEPLDIESLLQLVFFHPEYTFRDGGERSGLGSAANYARRSPWPMINLLRTSQVRTAQRGIPTGLVYKQNEKTLNKIGTHDLESMLRRRDWTPIADMKVDRKDMEALRVASDLQSTGIVSDEDKSFSQDSTPAANKVDRKSEIEGGNMANVLSQALEKRLGYLSVDEDGSNTPQPLSGAETSAAMMASDFLLEHLDQLKEKIATDNAQNNNSNEDGTSTSPMAQKAKYSNYFDDDDVYNDSQFDAPPFTEEDETSALFGGGISMNNDDDDSFTAGIDPRNFY
eukprot:CAMPEP_0184859456 /NCGR_PEP_ID=MMETSP0580-20130426/4456_1 /TAXON_ID=1118495 /ORGANISM="Dactyliosolen fragilissimus" /LENGTH=696 /DNA_ID=CAMNT_0027356095 /DNA_START=74 /DNA_END=2164 /DNA_ORIENTATION=-